MLMEDRARLMLDASASKLEAIDRILPGGPRMEPLVGPLLLSISHAAQLLGVSRATICRLLAAGRLEGVVLLPSANPRLRRTDIEELGRRPCRQD